MDSNPEKNDTFILISINLENSDFRGDRLRFKISDKKKIEKRKKEVYKDSKSIFYKK